MDRRKQVTQPVKVVVVTQSQALVEQKEQEKDQAADNGEFAMEFDSSLFNPGN